MTAAAGGMPTAAVHTLRDPWPAGTAARGRAGRAMARVAAFGAAVSMVLAMASPAWAQNPVAASASASPSPSAAAASAAARSAAVPRAAAPAPKAAGGPSGGPGAPGAAVPGPASPGPSAALEAAALQRTHDAALRRLEAVVQDRLDADKGRGRLRWREVVLPPDGDYLVWSPRTARSRQRGETYRIAIEIRTRWFYVARVERGQKPVFLGPLEEGRRGRFSEVLKTQR